MLSRQKIITTKIEFKDDINIKDIDKIIEPFAFDDNQKKESQNLIRSIYKTLINTCLLYTSDAADE